MTLSDENNAEPNERGGGGRDDEDADGFLAPDQIQLRQERVLEEERPIRLLERHTLAFIRFLLRFVHPNGGFEAATTTPTMRPRSVVTLYGIMVVGLSF